MPATDAISAIRTSARSFEQGLPPAQRKRLGQFFTGLPLGTLLAHIALDPNARAVIDPMAGHGDLLDAAALTARARGARLGRLDGIELDPESPTRKELSGFSWLWFCPVARLNGATHALD